MRLSIKYDPQLGMRVVDETGREVENLVGLTVYWDSHVNQAMITVDSPGWDLDSIATDQAYSLLTQLLEPQNEE